MNTKQIVCVLLAVGLLSGRVVLGEDEDKGVQRQYQATGSLNGHLNPHLEWRAAETLYWNGDHQQYANTTQAGLTWSAAHWLAFNGTLRVAHVDDANALRIRQRVTLSTQLKAPVVDHWGFSYRLYWQNDWRDPDEGGTKYRAYLRNQGQVRYTGFQHFAPFAAVEVWNRIDPNRTRSGMDRTRYTLGGEVEMTTRQSLELFARKQVYGNHDPGLYVGSVEYAYSFD